MAEDRRTRIEKLKQIVQHWPPPSKGTPADAEIREACEELYGILQDSRESKRGMRENCPECKVHSGHKAGCSIGYPKAAGDFSLKRYREFLKEKCPISQEFGIADIQREEIFETAVPGWIPKPHQIAAVLWAVIGGRRGLFESFGLGKTVQQLEILRLILKRIGGRALIVAPLGVKQEFQRDARQLQIDLKFIRTDAEVGETGIYLTNYESVRDGKLHPGLFTVATLDEAAILSSFGGTKTFREFMRLFAPVPYRYVATATPDPNEYIELLAYADFLGIMDTSQAKTRFFKRDSTKADKLTIHPHKEKEFWLWVSTWALFLNKPSDLGFDDTGYALPELIVVKHEVAVDHSTARDEKDGQARMFRNASHGVSEAAREKRDTINVRIQKMVEIINAKTANRSRGSKSEPTVLSRESRTDQRTGQESSQGTPSIGESGRKREEAAVHEEVASREPSTATDSRIQGPSQRGSETEIRDRCGIPETTAHPGQPMESGQSGEKESQPDESVRSHAGGIQRDTGESERDVRYLRLRGPVDQKNVSSGGSLSRDRKGSRVAVHAVQQRVRKVQGQPGVTSTGGGIPEQFIVWCDLNDEQNAVDEGLDRLGIEYSSLYGAQPVEEREAQLQDWRDRKTTAFVSKPMMYGAGVNLQQCSVAIFLGIGFKFRDWVQAIARIHRFLQKETVEIHIIYAESERLILQNLMEKWDRHKAQTARMAEIIREYGLSQAAIRTALSRGMGVERQVIEGKPQEDAKSNWTLINNDVVEEIHHEAEHGGMPSDSVHLILTSIPFSTQYEYSPNYADFGHSDSNEHFFEQMDFAIPQLYRVLQPGRLCCVHVKDRIVPGGITGLGFQIVYPFHIATHAAFTKHGFAYLGMKTIVTDVVRENNQTYRLGWTEQNKDGTKMGVGMPEYLLIFRKPPTDTTNAYADVPVVKNKPLCVDSETGEIGPYDKDNDNQSIILNSGYSRGRWQLDAHGFERSSGNRLLTFEELEGIAHAAIYRKFRRFSKENVYDYEHHVKLSEGLEAKRMLPSGFMLLPPQSWHPDVWTDITRMRTLNGSQWSKGKEMHLCPMQLDVAYRVITQCSMEGEIVFDPFGGLGTVPMCAIEKKRRAISTELNPSYFADSIAYVKAAEQKVNTPTLFDMTEHAGNPEDETPEELAVPEPEPKKKTSKKEKAGFV